MHVGIQQQVPVHDGDVAVQGQTSKPSGVVSSGGSMTPAELMRQCKGSSRFLNSSVQARIDLYCSQADTETLLGGTQLTHCSSKFLCLNMQSSVRTSSQPSRTPASPLWRLEIPA